MLQPINSLNSFVKHTLHFISSQELFKPFGNIARIFLAKDKVTGHCKGFAFVNYYRKEDATKARDTGLAKLLTWESGWDYQINEQGILWAFTKVELVSKGVPTIHRIKKELSISQS